VAVIGGGLIIAHKVRQAGFDPTFLRSNPGLAITKMMTAAKSNVEALSVNDNDQRITIRDKKTGKNKPSPCETTAVIESTR